MNKFLDEVVLHLKAGNGGNGSVHFHSEKFVEFGGPDGGNGGKGGDVYIRSNLSLQNLNRFLSKKNYKAGAGFDGMGLKKTGKNGSDIFISVPIGTEVLDCETDELLFDFTEENQTYLAAKGGRGGKGNEFFKSSTMQAPKFAQEGELGEEIYVRLNLKLIADIGLVGLPNAGKSTLLSKITSAHPKIASYAFTTLLPNLGVFIQDENNIRYTIADIPGIIEGASKGLGLGLSFLRHIERVKGIIYILDVNSMDILADFEMLKSELNTYNSNLIEKKHLILLNKVDLFDDESFTKEFISNYPDLNLVPISAYSGFNLEYLRELILDFF